MAERLKVGAPPAEYAGVECAGIPIHFLLFGSPYHCGYGFASTPCASGASALFGHAASLAEPRLENWQTRQHLCVFRIAFHLLNSTPRWWGGRAVEGTSLENWQTRQGLEGSNPSPTVCRAACEPGGSRRLLKRRASLSLRSIDDLSSAQIKVFTLPKEERIPPPPFRALATRFATCSLWCLIVLATTQASGPNMCHEIIASAVSRSVNCSKRQIRHAIRPARSDRNRRKTHC